MMAAGQVSTGDESAYHWFAKIINFFNSPKNINPYTGLQKKQSFRIWEEMDPLSIGGMRGIGNLEKRLGW